MRKWIVKIEDEEGKINENNLKTIIIKWKDIDKKMKSIYTVRFIGERFSDFSQIKTILIYPSILKIIFVIQND